MEKIVHMKKTLADLLRDVFSHYTARYFGQGTYGAYINSIDMCSVMKLPIPQGEEWATPALILKQYGSDKENVELIFTAHAPDPGQNSQFYGEMLTAGISAFKQGHNMLWLHPDGGLAGMTRIMKFDEKAIALNNFRVELIAKINEYFISGEYSSELKSKKAVATV